MKEFGELFDQLKKAQKQKVVLAGAGRLWQKAVKWE
ncbi:MAG: hypothetical protein PWQ84_1511 [Thermotogaceae bacterium]|nr:hypothetical protein [Thermotogaceae bacterium]